MATRSRTLAPARVSISFLVLIALVCGQAWSQQGGPGKSYRTLSNVATPMSDGTVLRADIHLPQAEGRHPVLLARTPYGRQGQGQSYAAYFTRLGYAVMAQDCRGKGGSAGNWDPFTHEAQDGLDTHQWILQQPWSDGAIGTFGGSYVGFTQWVSAPGAGDYLKCMAPLVPLIEPYYDGGFYDGAVRLALGFGWGTEVSFRPDLPAPAAHWQSQQWDKAFRTLPLTDWDKTIGTPVPYLQEWIDHYRYDDYWKQRGTLKGIGAIKAPILMVGGWYDIFAETALRHVETLKQSANPAPATHVIMGPWVHNLNQNGKVGELDFGRESRIDLLKIHAGWYDHWLKGKDNGVAGWPAYRIFVMGRNQWRDEPQWPLARAVSTPFYLGSQGKANGVKGDGSLGLTTPGDQPADKFVYDPENPVPTLGGGNLTGCPAGPYNQERIEKRDDVLVYTSAPLENDLEATGPVKVTLYAASDALDTDWTAKLCIVREDGQTFNLCDGIFRARFRNSFEKEELLTPGQVEQYTIDLGVTSNVFLKGQRIRLEIASSNFPRFDRNLNTGGPIGREARFLKANQTIYHDPAHPSCLILPVIP